MPGARLGQRRLDTGDAALVANARKTSSWRTPRESVATIGLAGLDVVATSLVRHSKAAAAKLADADLCLPASIGHDPAHLLGACGADEADPKVPTVPEIGGVDDIDHRHDVPATLLAIQRDEGREEPPGQYESEETDGRLHQGVTLEH